MNSKQTLEEIAERLTNDFPVLEVRFNMTNEEIKGWFLEALQKGVKWEQDNSNINALDFEIDSLKRNIKLLKYQQEEKNKIMPTQNNNQFVFVYTKESKVKVLDLETSKELHNSMIKEGYKHISTLDPCKWIEHILNQDNDEDVLRELKDFSK